MRLKNDTFFEIIDKAVSEALEIPVEDYLNKIADVEESDIVGIMIKFALSDDSEKIEKAKKIYSTL